jgi:hypothetical protein
MKSYAYVSLEDVLRQIVAQAKKDVKWIRPRLTGITSIEQLFYRLKDATTYRDDPPNTELIQSPRSLFEKNFYNQPGTGDCDCFTCLSICCFAALGIESSRVKLVLTGDTASTPLHIYSEVDGYSFDLTNESFNFQRPYRYHQLINLQQLWKQE